MDFLVSQDVPAFSKKMLVKYFVISCSQSLLVLKLEVEW